MNGYQPIRLLRAPKPRHALQAPIGAGMASLKWHRAIASGMLAVQVTTHSTLSALAYDTGGLLIDAVWLRLLGSGQPRLTRTLSEWNAGRATDYYLVGDDAAGGFFAINGGALGSELGVVYYLLGS